jgi:hypothetical protein
MVRLEVSVAFTLRDFLVPESIVERESKWNCERKKDRKFVLDR